MPMYLGCQSLSSLSGLVGGIGGPHVTGEENLACQVLRRRWRVVRCPGDSTHIPQNLRILIRQSIDPPAVFSLRVPAEADARPEEILGVETC